MRRSSCITNDASLLKNTRRQSRGDGDGKTNSVIREMQLLAQAAKSTDIYCRYERGMKWILPYSLQKEHTC